MRSNDSSFLSSDGANLFFPLPFGIEDVGLKYALPSHCFPRPNNRFVMKLVTGVCREHQDNDVNLIANE